MQISLINLDRSTERLAEFKRINPHLANVKRFSAIEGSSVAAEDLIKRKIFEEPIFYSPGAIGNALSHIGVWQEAARSHAYTTVLEDDAIVHKDFEKLAPPIIASLLTDWDIVLWGWNFDSALSFDVFADTPCAARFSQTDLRKHWTSIQQSAVKPQLHRLRYAFGSIGYTISPAGAKKLTALALPIKPFFYKIPAFDLEIQNEAMDCVMTSLYDSLNAYVSFPPLVMTRNDLAASTFVRNFAEADHKEQDFKLTPLDITQSRKFRRKRARYLFKKGDIVGGSRAYLKYLATPKAR